MDGSKSAAIFLVNHEADATQVLLRLSTSDLDLPPDARIRVDMVKVDYSATTAPTSSPTRTPPPSHPPTQAPTMTPSAAPTLAPSLSPTFTPSHVPTEAPTGAPSPSPTFNLSNLSNLSHAPTNAPMREPTSLPTRRPTRNPTPRPTGVPTLSPTPFVFQPPRDAYRHTHTIGRFRGLLELELVVPGTSVAMCVVTHLVPVPPPSSPPALASHAPPLLLVAVVTALSLLVCVLVLVVACAVCRCCGGIRGDGDRRTRRCGGWGGRCVQRVLVPSASESGRDGELELGQPGSSGWCLCSSPRQRKRPWLAWCCRCLLPPYERLRAEGGRHSLSFSRPQHEDDALELMSRSIGSSWDPSSTLSRTQDDADSDSPGFGDEVLEGRASFSNPSFKLEFVDRLA